MTIRASIDAPRPDADDAVCGLRAYADATLDLAWLTDVDGAIEYANARCSKRIGEGARDGFLAALPPEDRARVEEAHAHAVRERLDFERELRLRLADGECRWHLLRSVVVRDRSGAPSKRFVTAIDVDDRKRLEIDAAAAKERFEAALAGMTDGFVMFDREWRYVFANEEWLRFVNRRFAEVKGKALWEVAPYLVGTPLHRQLERSMNEKVAVRFECWSQGRAQWFEIRAYPTDDGISVFSTSIHEAKLARQAVEEQEKWLEAAFNLVPVPLCFIEPGSGKVLFANRAADRMAGGEVAKNVPLEEYARHYALTDGDDVPIPNERTAASRVARGEKLEGDEVVWHTAAGRFHLLLAGDTLPAMHGHPATCVVVVQDITRLKDYERAVKTSEARFRALFEQSPVSLQIFAKTGECTFVNPAWERHFATKREQLEGFNLFRDPQLREGGLLPLIERSFAGESIRTPTHRFDPAASGRVGKAVWQDVYMFPIRSEDGAVDELAVIAMDVTDQYEARRRLEQAVAARDDFLSSASHELRTPITSMRLRLELARRAVDRGDEGVLAEPAVRALIEQMLRATARLARLVDDMLDITRIQAGTFRLDPIDDDLARVLAEVLERMGPLLAEAQMPVYVSTPPHAPARFDPLRIEQVIGNLVTNAIRYAPGRPLTVRLETTEKQARIVVADQGPGVAPADRERIFDRFERLATPKHVSGLGLGLYIVREIATAHGGRVWVEGTEGATFVVEIPIAGP